MKLTKNARRVFVVNIIMTIIGHSRGLECVTKAFYTNPDGEEKIAELEGDEAVKCSEQQTFCLTASGSFKIADEEYEVESLRMCALPFYCGTNGNPFGADELGQLLSMMDYAITLNIPFTPGSTAVTRECCEGENCNKPQETTTTTTTTSSGYSIHKINYNDIVLVFAVSGILFF